MPSRPLLRLHSSRPRPLSLLPLAMIHSSKSRLPHHLPQNQTEYMTQAITYHDRTKHSLTSGYARGPGRLDWANQPNPFCSFTPPLPSPLIIRPFSILSLPLLSPSPSPPSNPFSTTPSLSRLGKPLPSLPGPFGSTQVVATSTRLSATFSLLPSLIPLTTPLLFLSHYSPKDHSLEIRAVVPPNLKLPIPSDSLIAVFSSIFWREAWKYDERALRYCNHDVGHTIAALAISTAALGWDAKLLDSLSHSGLEALLGVTKT